MYYFQAYDKHHSDTPVPGNGMPLAWPHRITCTGKSEKFGEEFKQKSKREDGKKPPYEVREDFEGQKCQ